MNNYILNVISFFKSYNINLEKDKILLIKDVKIPNLLLDNTDINIKWEFCHLLYKLYAPYLKYDYIFYENKKYKINNQDIIFDCGANMGLFSAYAATKGAQVYSFEPMSFTRSLLYKTSQLYNNITIIPYAISNKNTQVFFEQCDNPGASHNSLYNINQENKILYKEKVKVLSLDWFVNTYKIIPTFLKIDIEGSERELILGFSEGLKKYQPILSMSSYHYKNDNIFLSQLLLQINKNYNIEYFFEEREKGSYLFCK